MLVFLLACSGKGDTGEPADTGASDWVETTLGASPFGFVAWDGAAGWAVGEGGRVVAIDGAWTDAEGASETVRAVDARDGELWALTTTGIARWTGGAWVEEPLPEEVLGATVMTVRADASVVVVDAEMDCDDCEGAVMLNRVAVWDGAAWTITDPALTEPSVTALDELDDGTLVGAGSGGEIGTWNGAAWTFTEAGATRLEDIEAVGDEVVAVGDGGLVVRGPLDALRVETADTDDLVRVDIGDDGTAWALARTAAWVDDGTGWTALALPEGDWADVAATPDGAIVVGDDLGPVGLTGDAGGFAEAWREVSIQGSVVWVDDEGAAWITGGGAGRWAADGTLTAWRLPDEAMPSAIGGGGPDDVVVVGFETLVTWDGAAWTSTALDDGVQLWDVSVAPDRAAFAVGSRRDGGEVETPILLRRTDAGWIEEAATSATSARVLMAVQAFAEDDVVVLTWGGETQLLHWDGAAWTAMTGALGFEYTVLWGRSATDLYLGGGERDGGASLVHWDGTDVTAVAGAPFGVEDLAGNDDVLLVAGVDGYGDDWAPVVTEYRDGVWTEAVRPEGGGRVGVSGDEEVIVGSGVGWRRR